MNNKFLNQIIWHQENAHLFRKFQAIFMRKNFVPRFLLVLNHTRLLTSTSALKNYIGWWELEYFYNTRTY